MSVRSLSSDAPYGGGFRLGNAITWDDIQAENLTLNTLTVADLYVGKLHSGEDEQVPDVFYYGQFGMSGYQAGNTAGAGSTTQVAQIIFPDPVYDGAPGDVFSPSIQLTLTRTPGTATAPLNGTTSSTPGYLSPIATLYSATPGNGQCNGFWITVPALIPQASPAPDILTPIWGTLAGQAVSWYAIGVPPSSTPSPWNRLQPPIGAYDAVSNPFGWRNYPLAGGAGFSTFIIPIGVPLTSSGIVGIDDAAVLPSAVTVPASPYYPNVAAEAADFPIILSPVAPTTGATSPQSPIPTSATPTASVFIQALLCQVPGNSAGGGTGGGAAQNLNITQAMMLGQNDGTLGSFNPYITGGAGAGYGIRARLYAAAPVATSRNPDGQLYLQVLLGWGLKDPLLATPTAGFARTALTGWYGNPFFSVAPPLVSLGGTAFSPTFHPRLTILLGVSTGATTGQVPLSLSGVRWTTNETATDTTLYEKVFVNTGFLPPQNVIWYTGNPNFPLQLPTSGIGGVGTSNVIFYPNGFVGFQNVQVNTSIPEGDPPAQPPSSTNGWYNARAKVEYAP
jgi:hypothetical protein